MRRAAKYVLPGFHDPHVHPGMGGDALLGCDLAGLASVEAIVSEVTACVASSNDDWLEGQAFDLSLFGQNGPHKSLLDVIDTDRPIILWADDGHNAWANSRALERVGITADTPAPALGVIERDPDGSPSGTLRETAQELVRAVLPRPDLEADVQALRDENESNRLNHDSIKLFLDGVLEGETAALLEPYLGVHGNRGELILSPEELKSAVTRFDAMGLQVHMHAIGDRAVRSGLDAIEAARQQNGVTANRHHISHLQLVHVDDIERFATLDTTANFQADWAYPDDWILELNLPVLGEERVQGMYPIGSVERAGPYSFRDPGNRNQRGPGSDDPS